MESFSPTWAAYALVWVATVVIAHLSKHFHQKKLNLPPGPRQWPIIGNLNLIGTLPHRSLHQLSLTYGPLMHLQFGSFPNSIVTPEEFRQMLDEVFLLTGVFNIGDFIPWIDFLDLQGYIKRMKILSKKFDRFLEHILDEHNAQRKDETDCVSKDMVDVLLGLADDPTLEVKLERHGVKALILDLLAGGTETSATTVEWAISELLKNPEILNKAAEELDRVIGQNRWVNEKDMPNLPYIEAIVKETMRMHPVVPLLVPRCAREDCKVAGYDIQKGTRVIVNVWSIVRDPESWEKPEVFWPDRFMGKDIDFKGQDCKFLPFGAGRRMCPGYSLGLKVIQSSLANLLHGYRWKLPNDMKPEDLDMEEIFGLTTPRKIPLVAIVEPRLPCNLYSL
ncbi:unnamed protein product [Coffea canephora]|uniref:Cytochrome P450 n=1 Tax=Coffea canephora TaxID=49390 RepID=A0A068UWN3_COFCA|nr:unnamed protein product [Coffea canephora]